MDKLKLFLENFIIYGFSGIISKIIPLIMVPIVTRLMPNATYYGISDMSNTIVSLGSAIAIMGMYDAMYRMFFEKENSEYQKNICSTAFAFTLFTSLAVFLALVILKDFIAQVFFGSKDYAYLVYITAIATLVGASNSIVSAPTRMQNKREIYLIMNTVTPILSYSISIPLLINGYYIIALPLAGLVSSLANELVFLFLNKQWFSLRKIDFSCLKPMLKLAIPLLPNFLIYWIFNSSDRLMITNLIRTDATGIYSVGPKLGQASQLIYTAFAGGWQFFAFSTMRDKNQVKINSNIFEYLGIISYGFTVFVFALSEPIYNLLFTGEYVNGFIVAPYLFLAPLLQMLFQVACNQFLVVKKTWPNFFILFGGAMINVILNFILIPVIGIEGAAIATLIGYVASDIVVVIVLEKMKLMDMNFSFILASIIMLGFIIGWRLCWMHNILLSVLLAAFCCILFVYLYRNDVHKLIQMLRGNS